MVGQREPEPMGYTDPELHSKQERYQRK
jgi:hypothetical protein